MVFNKILAILRMLNEEKTVDTYVISRKLRIPIEEVESLLGLLLSHGYIEQKEVAVSCHECPLRHSCPVAGRDTMRVYTITSKGKNLLEKRLRS
ncbi:MAG: hypothetical protein DRJ37_04715 [Thermoprotei archaeon]|nr:MAG: hypothetical protein DRJ37_04715 [Thermoprotei archaeon]